MMNAQINLHKNNNACTLATPFGTCFHGGFQRGSFPLHFSQVVETEVTRGRDFNDQWLHQPNRTTTFVTFQLCMFKVLYPPGKYHISYLGKLGKSSTQKCRLLWDMLVPRRVSQFPSQINMENNQWKLTKVTALWTLEKLPFYDTSFGLGCESLGFQSDSEIHFPTNSTVHIFTFGNVWLIFNSTDIFIFDFFSDITG